MDVLLIQPPIQDFYLTAKRTIPYGLACIAASLERAGFTVGILDALATDKSRPLPLPPEMSYLDEFYDRPDISPFCLFHQYRHFGYSFQHLERRIRESGAFLLGVSSLFSAYAKEAEKTAEIAKKALPGAAIVVGGHHPTALPEDVMKWNSVDYAIRGEGEVSLPILADSLLRGGDISHVPGIVFKKRDGNLHISSPAIMNNLDSVPPPDRSLLKNAYYTRRRSPSTVVVTSRGCPMHCTYCSLGNREFYPYRQRSVDSVFSEIREAVEDFGARFIDFEDENLSFRKEWFITLLNEISGRFGHRDLELRAMNGLYPPTLDEDVVSAMKVAGFRTLNLSLGATCPEQLERFCRPDVRDAFDSCLELAEKYSLEAVGYVICGAPGQSAVQSIEDLLYLAGRRVLAGLSVFYPAPGSKDYEVSKRLGILPEDVSLFRASAIPISHSTSRRESVTLMRLARIINFMKQLIDQGRQLPAPAPIIEEQISTRVGRQDIGEKLLAAFLFDSQIRGVSPDGSIYTHSTENNISRQFLSGLKNITIKSFSRIF